MPLEPNAYWWPIAVIAVAIVGVGAVWFTGWVVSRLDKDRHKLHEHGTELQVHKFEITELKDDVKDLKRKGE